MEKQSIAYSLDEGNTWTKYKGNPVLPNPGIRDFRDPKVMWIQASQKWIMTLATLDHITFYSSPNLTDWKEESKFGKNIGAHGGVWECPDLIPFTVDGKQVWLLIVNLNPGGPNGGSATQYFVGNFNGAVFTPFDTDTRWLDYGPDSYAGITWSNTGDRKIFLGWMSNWQYANLVPTQNWRSAMTLSRELSVKKVNGRYLAALTPVKELGAIAQPISTASNLLIKNQHQIAKPSTGANGLFKLELAGMPVTDFSIALTNTKGDEVLIGFTKATNQFYIDRTRSGATAFEKGFAQKHTAPRLATGKNINLTLVGDAASVELFADDGLTVMTSIFFPSEPLSEIVLKASGKPKIHRLTYSAIQPAAQR